MTRDHLKSRMPIIQSWIDTKPLQYKTQKSGWVDEEMPTFGDIMNPNLEWRVKSEPRRWWIKYVQGHGWIVTGSEAAGAFMVIEVLE